MKTNNIHRFHIILARSARKYQNNLFLLKIREEYFQSLRLLKLQCVLVAIDCTVNLWLCLVYSHLTVHFVWFTCPILKNQDLPQLLCSRALSSTLRFLFFLRTLRYVQPVL